MEGNVKLLNTGITGLDLMLNGGIPEGHIVTALGSFGTGKTTLALQFTHAGLSNGSNCIYMSLEEDEEELVETAEMFGWGFKQYIEDGKLILIKLSALNIKSTIERIEHELPDLFRTFNAERLAVDPITLYEMILDTDTERRNHLFNFAQMVKESGITALFTSETDKNDPYSSKYGLVEYISDGVISLRQVRAGDLHATTTIIEVSKMRRMEHSREIKPYNITKDGIVVHVGSAVFSPVPDYPVAME